MAHKKDHYVNFNEVESQKTLLNRSNPFDRSPSASMEFKKNELS